MDECFNKEYISHIRVVDNELDWDNMEVEGNYAVSGATV